MPLDMEMVGVRQWALSTVMATSPAGASLATSVDTADQLAVWLSTGQTLTAQSLPGQPAPLSATRRLGRQPRSHDPRIPKVSALRRAANGIPSAHSWLTGMPDDLGMMLNDRLGCCTCSGLGHFEQVTSFHAGGAENTLPDAAILALYEEGCGYVAGDASTDQGGNEQQLLAKALRGIPTPAGAYQIAAFYEVDVGDLHAVMSAIWECGAAYIGIDIPQSWTEAQAGDTWDATDSPSAGGHCVILAGYDETGFDVVSSASMCRRRRNSSARSRPPPTRSSTGSRRPADRP